MVQAKYARVFFKFLCDIKRTTNVPQTISHIPDKLFPFLSFASNCGTFTPYPLFRCTSSTLDKIKRLCDIKIFEVHIYSLNHIYLFRCSLQEFTDLANPDHFKSFSDKLAELLFSVVIYHAAIDSNKMKSCQWNHIAFDIACKLLCFNQYFLDGWVTTAIAGSFL